MLQVKKPHSIISFFPIYTKLCNRRKGRSDKLKQKLYKCLIILVIIFLEKKSMITLANEAWQMGTNTSSLVHPTVLSCDKPFPNSLQFPKKKNLFGEHNPSTTAFVFIQVHSWIYQ